MAVSAKLAQFTRDYPDVVLDITTEDDSRRDLIAGRFDAGIHLGEFVQKDMVAVKVTAPQRAAIVGALVVLIATFWPARRAASVDPMQAMRAD